MARRGSQCCFACLSRPITSRGCGFPKSLLRAAPRLVSRRQSKQAESFELSPRVRPPLQGISVAAGKKKAVTLGAQIQMRGPNLRPREWLSGHLIHLLLPPWKR